MSSSPPSPGKQEETGRRDELTELLADVEWMWSRLHAGGVAGLLTDYTSISEQPELALVQETILLSAHVLVVDPDQLPAQLAGRTIGRCEPARARLHAVTRAWPHAAPRTRPTRSWPPATSSTRTGRRDHAMLALAVQAGLRVSELTSLTCADIRIQAGPHIHCTGKGRKERDTPLLPATVRSMKAWLAECGGQPGDPRCVHATKGNPSRMKKAHCFLAVCAQTCG